MSTFFMSRRLRLSLLFVGFSICSVDAFTASPTATRRCIKQHHRGYSRMLASALYSLTSQCTIVDGIECRQVTIDVQLVGPVTILEATAKAQDDLVDMALALNEDELTAVKQLLQSGDPYGAVLWPAASAISNHLMTQCSTGGDPPLEGLSILELGTGTGLVSLAASLGGATKILATDYESVPLRLLQEAQAKLNKGLTTIETALLDITDLGTPLPPADIVVAADIMYEPMTGRAMAHRAVEALQRGSRVLVGDSPGRAGRPAFLAALQELGITDALFVNTVGRTCSGARHDLICGKDSTSISETPKDMEVAIMDLDPNTTLL